MSRLHKRMSRGRWAALRKSILDRDGWRCRQCGRAGILEVDHIHAIEDGGDPWDPANLQTLCKSPCHRDKTRIERKGDPTPEMKAWAGLVEAITS